MKSKASLGVFLLAAIHICYKFDGVHSLNSTNANKTSNAEFINDQLTTFQPLLNPCLSSPCGPNAQCIIENSGYTCKCLPNFINKPPNCRAECSTNEHCLSNETCVNQHCMDPCLNEFCGVNAECRVQNHTLICECRQIYTGDALVESSLMNTTSETQNDACNPNPCGNNAMCREQNGVASCMCLPDFYGNPDLGCVPKCFLNSECPPNQMCLQGMCFDPCPGVCPGNAKCVVQNHLPVCICIAGYTGNSYEKCTKMVANDVKVDPCKDGYAICGSNSRCKAVKDIAVCSCLPGYNGSPPDCISGCMTSSECASHKACVNRTCVDPCKLDNICGTNTNCTVVNQAPVCNCLEGFTGDPFRDCHPLHHPPFSHPCVVSPCGPNSECRLDGNTFSCHCLPGFINNPPNCKPECVLNTDCPLNLSCIDKRCKNPCDDDICGVKATCRVKNHTPICECPNNYTGDPFVKCTLNFAITTTILSPTTTPTTAPTTTPTTTSTTTTTTTTTRTTTVSSEPEGCDINEDCADDKSCVDYKCSDPCVNGCGVESVCIPSNHYAYCDCKEGYTGNPYLGCYEILDEVRNTTIEFLALYRGESMLYVVWKLVNPNDTSFSDYRVAIEPPDAKENVLYVKREKDPLKLLDALFEGLVPGRAYNISIQLKSGDTVSKPTVATYRTIPLKPVNVTLDKDATTPSKFRISWEAPDNRTEFDEYEVTIHSDSESFEFYQQFVSREGDMTSSFGARKNIEPGQTYQVTVRTVSGNVNSVPEVLNVTTKPLPVENLKYFADNTGEVMVLWDVNKGSVQDQYKLSYHEVQKNNTNPMDKFVKTNRTDYIFDTLSQNKNYSVSVQAVSKGVESDKLTIYVSIPGMTPPSKG